MKRRRGRSGRNGSEGVLDRLKPEEAATVLHQLLKTDPGLRRKALRAARSLLEDVSFEGVADEIEASVKDLDLDDLHARAGRHEGGYVDPSQAAWDLLEEAVEPFLDDIKRNVELGHEAAALEILKGVVLGLYRIEQDKDHPVAGWAPDFPRESAGSAVEAWRKGGARGRRRAQAGRLGKAVSFPPEFMDGFDAGWRNMLERLVSPANKP